MRNKPISLTLGLIALLAAASVVADDFSLEWWTIDGGGGMWTTGVAYELSGTIGQPDASAMTGGDFALTGGFWAVVHTTPAPLPGDCDDDGDVDLVDFANFSDCLLGPDRGVGSNCDCFDLDDDGDVDLADFTEFQAYFTGN